jgi:hypothetical protein
MNHDDDEERPLFASLEDMCAAFGWSDEVRERIRRDMEATARIADARDAQTEQGVTLH